MRIDELIGQARAVRQEVTLLMAQGQVKEAATQNAVVQNPQGLILFPAPAKAPTLASGPTSLELAALKLGELYTRLDSAANALHKAGDLFNFTLATAEAKQCAGVMAAVGRFSQGAALAAGAAAALEGQVPPGYQTTKGGLLVPSKAA